VRAFLFFFLILIAGLTVVAANHHASWAATLEPGLLTREAIIESGLPPRTPNALDSAAHPWPGVALSLSVTGTAVPVVVALQGNRHERDPGLVLSMFAVEIFSPSAGHVYAGLHGRAVKGMIARGVGFAILAAGGASNGTWNGKQNDDLTYGDLAMVLGATIMGVAAAVDVITVPTDVENRNTDWLRQHGSLGLRLAPDATPELALTLQF
jgi:hypothetical protein